MAEILEVYMTQKTLASRAVKRPNQRMINQLTYVFAPTHGKSGHFKANCCRVGVIECVTAILSDAVLGRAELVVPAGTTLHAHNETEFSNEVHEPIFKLEDELELSIPAPKLVGPTTRTLTLGPLPPGSRPCWSTGFAASSEN